jgi:hypothetical protein
VLWIGASTCRCFRSKQTQDIWAAPRLVGVALYLAVKRSLDRARKRSRPVRVTIAPPKTSGHTLRSLPPRKQSGLEPLSRLDAAPWQPHQLISGRALLGRTKILHTRGSSAPRWMGLLSRTADKGNPTSSVTHPSRLWPGSVGQTHSQLARKRDDHDAADATLQVPDDYQIALRWRIGAPGVMACAAAMIALVSMP